MYPLRQSNMSEVHADSEEEAEYRRGIREIIDEDRDLLDALD